MSEVVLTWQAWFTIAVVVLMFLLLSFTRLRADVAFLGTVVALYVAGILDVRGAFGGFCSESVLIVAAMFCVIAGLERTGVLNWVVDHLMGNPKSYPAAIVHVMFPVAALSSVLSNTTIVALFVNVVKNWSRKLGMSPSRLLIPLSYAAGMGGICTLIGTPPNMIISGMYTSDTGITLGIFTPLLCGLFCMVVGVLSMIAMRKLLPERKSPLSSAEESDLTTVLKVPQDTPWVGMTVAEALRESGADKTGAKVMGIRRFDNEVVIDNLDEAFIMGTDRILVAGTALNIERLALKMGFVNEFLASVVKVEETKVSGWKTLASALVLVAMITLSAFKVLTLLEASLLAAGAMMLLKCCTPEQSMKALDWSVLIIFGSSVAIGSAIESTGLAEFIANKLLALSGSSPWMVLACLCLVSTFVTEFISNTAAGAICYPIAMSAATAIGANPLTFCVALMISVSSSFATPIGSPTHMLVYLPGGYKFGDFVRVGLPMNIIILAANLFITPLLFPL